MPKYFIRLKRNLLYDGGVINKSDTEPTVETFNNRAAQAMDSIFGGTAPSCGTVDLFHFPRPQMLSHRMSLNVRTCVAFNLLNSAPKLQITWLQSLESVVIV